MIQLHFNEDFHEYNVDGKIIVSNTQILSACKIIDKRFYTPESAARGKHKHRLAEEYLKNILNWLCLNNNDLNFLQVFQRFLDENVKKVLAIEISLNKGDEFAGTIDLIYIDKENKIVVCDYKTGNPEAWHKIQLAGYIILACTKYKVDFGKLLYINEKNYKLSDPIDQVKTTDIFLSALKIYKWKHKNDR